MGLIEKAFWFQVALAFIVTVLVLLIIYGAFIIDILTR